LAVYIHNIDIKGWILSLIKKSSFRNQKDANLLHAFLLLPLFVKTVTNYEVMKVQDRPYPVDNLLWQLGVKASQ
jgi:hypothetical protein